MRHLLTKTNSALLAAIVAGGLAFLLSACGDKGTAPPETISFVTKTMPIEFSFPRGWRENPEQNPYDLQCLSKFSTMTSGVFVYGRDDFDAGETARSILSLQVADLESKRQNFRVLSEIREFEDDGRKFTTGAYTAEKNSTANCYRFTLIEFTENPDHLAIVLQTAFPDEWDKVEPILDGITRSAKLLPGAKPSGASTEIDPGGAE